MIRPHSGPYPHVAGCAGCRVRRLCDVCGTPIVLRAGSRQQLAVCVAVLSRCLAHAGALVLCVLLSVASASAECAWVMWSTHMRKSILYDHTEPADAYKTKGECDLAFKQATTEAKERRKTDPDLREFYICLPDTVDPRGPRGK